ncbi:MAG TPA: type IV secretory system conjugative DNA transfer family protein, partial [Thermoanaerobaculia bacterium]|nr:type IV secretory system conjugative DNA transfer family protein [Thermoanaerobaculia bacterium]
MTLKPLYQLPNDVSTFRRITRRYLALALFVDVFVFWGVSQLCAHRLFYHPALGRPWLPQPSLPQSALQAGAALCLTAVVFAIVGLLPRPALLPLLPAAFVLSALAFGPLYSPAHVFVWASKLGRVDAVAPLLLAARTSASLAAGGILVAALFAALIAAPKDSKADIHGSARFARKEDLEAQKLLHPFRNQSVVGPRGLFLGCWSNGRRRFTVYDDTDVHVFAFAPTRTGKGVALVIPNLLMWPGSALVIDVKSEIFQLTSGYRSGELGNHCLRFDPTTPGTTRYNPLAEVRLGDNEVRDAQNVADILVDPNGDRPRDHWDRTAHALLTAVILHILYAEQDKTLRGCATLLSKPGVDVSKTLERMVTCRHTPTGPHPVIASLAQAVRDKAKEERSSVVSTALSFLDLYRDPLIAANTSQSDFRLADLMNQERPVTLYLTLPPSDLSRTRPLIRLLLNQVCRRLTEHQLEFVDGQPRPHYRHKLLLVMDELTALGKLAFFAESLAYLAGYGIRALLVAQDLSQLQGAYGPRESITSNAHFRIAYAPNKPETAELISQMAGQMTVHQDRLTR